MLNLRSFSGFIVLVAGLEIRPTVGLLPTRGCRILEIAFIFYCLAPARLQDLHLGCSVTSAVRLRIHGTGVLR